MSIIDVYVRRFFDEMDPIHIESEKKRRLLVMQPVLASFLNQV